MGVNTWHTACSIHRSLTAGTPRFLLLPSSFGISTRLTGKGLYFLRRIASHSSSPCASINFGNSLVFMRSTPALPLLLITLHLASSRFSLDRIRSIISVVMSAFSFPSLVIPQSSQPWRLNTNCSEGITYIHESQSWFFVLPFAPFPLRNFFTTTASADSSAFVVTTFPLRDVLHLASTSIRSPRRRCDNFPLV